MRQSQFIEIVNKWFGAIAKKITETINGKKDAPTYLHDTMLTPEYSADLKWDSAAIDGAIVAADVVSMDSPLPLKKRDSLSKASGDIPKLGMKLVKGEKLITDMQIMAARGASQAQIVAKLFSDAPRCASGVKERIEIIFQQGLSTGVGLVEDQNNVGTGVRIDYGFLPKNKYGVATKWGEIGYTPISDIANVLENASDSITTIMCSKKAYNLIRTSDEGKELSANFRGLVITADAKLPVPTPSQFNDAMSDEYGITFKIMDRTFKTEKNGVRSNIKPFDENSLVFLSSENVGRLVYGTLAEETNPVEGVKYEKVGQYILLSKYSKVDPLREFTTSQALVVPVIDNVDQIYLLNIEEAQVVDAAKEAADTTDVKVTIWGVDLTKSTVIAAVKALGIACPSNITDATLIKKINELSAEQEVALKEALNVTA